MAEQVYQIYDKVFKKILTLSIVAVINLINGLFGTNYPKDSTITYNWTEFEDDGLRRTLADTILTVNGQCSYHMEAQMKKDNDIVFRIFEYGYGHAQRNGSFGAEDHILKFPEPKVIYLYAEGEVPETYKLQLDFGTQGRFMYEVSTLNIMDTNIEELNQKKIIILVPFYLLKLRKALDKERSPENLEALQNLIENDIIGSITTNLKLGNISMGDARRLKSMTQMLYKQIYAHYDGMEKMNAMMDEALLLDIDIIEKEHEKELAKMDRELQEKKSELQEKESELQEKESELQEKESELQEKKSELQEKESKLQESLKENAALKEEIRRLKAFKN